jgi:hypothetical protein
MSFDSIFHGAPSSSGGQSVSSGRCSLGIDVVAGQVYFRNPETGAWTAIAGDGSVQETTLVLTSAQLLAMTNSLATAVPAIAAPLGPNQAIELISFSSNLQFNSVAYTTGTGNLILGVNQAGTIAAVSPINMLSNAEILSGSSAYSFGSLSNSGSAVSSVSEFVNQAMYIALSNAVQFLAGNSPITITIRYRIITLK